MKKRAGVVLMAVLCLAGLAAVSLYFWHSIPKGDTRESRERILNEAISKGNGWTIAKELELDGYIISGASSTDHKSALAVFEPTGNGGYRFRTSTNRNAEEIIIDGTLINGVWYNLIWFAGAETEYAEITCTANEQEDTLRYDTGNMEIIAIPNQAKEYTLHVVYYDKDGNMYE